MKSIAQLLAEKADAVRAINKRNAQLVDEVLAENAGQQLEAKLKKLTDLEETHKRIVAPIKKNNGVSDNNESFSESAGDDTVGRDELIAAAMKVFPELCPDKESAARFASDRSSGARQAQELIDYIGGK